MEDMQNVCCNDKNLIIFDAITQSYFWIELIIAVSKGWPQGWRRPVLEFEIGKVVVLGVVLGLALVLGIVNPKTNPNPFPNPKINLKLTQTPTQTLNTKNGYFLTVFWLDFGFSNPNPDPNPKTNPKTNPNPTLTLKLGSATPWPPLGHPLAAPWRLL